MRAIRSRLARNWNLSTPSRYADGHATAGDNCPTGDRNADADARQRQSLPQPPFRSCSTSAGEASSIYWGVNMPGVPWDMNTLSAWERDVTGKVAAVVNWGHFWGNTGGYRAWSNGTVNSARSHGAIPLISWTPEGGTRASGS